jgi:uncharacterized membrane protein
MPTTAAPAPEVPHPERDERVLYIAAYLFTWLSGIILYITMGQTNKRMKFHAIQAILLGIATFVIAWIPLPFFYVIAFVMWIYGMYIGVVAYNGRDISMPVLGEYAEKYST